MFETGMGFIDIEHLFDQRVTDVGIETVRDAIDRTNAYWTEQLNELMSEFVVQSTAIQRRFTLPGSGTLQPLDETGIPMPVKGAQSYTVAFPLQGGGTAWGNDRVTRAKMTVQEANDATMDGIRRDADWMRRHILSAFLTKENWTFEDPEHGDLPIKALANNDGQPYLLNNQIVAADHSHYLAQAAAIDDANNIFPTVRRTLLHHPGNGGEVLAFVASDLSDDITAMASFMEESDPVIVLGVGEDRLRNNGEQFRAFGDEVLGRVSRVWIIEWDVLPSGYGFAYTTDTGNIINMRQHPEAELQGFFSEFHSPDGAREENRAIRYAGFAPMNRTGAVAFQIGAAEYTTPAAYAAPLAV